MSQPSLSPAGQALVQQMAQTHGFSADAVAHMLASVAGGHGLQAQFNHPEFGGLGQWMSGGMTMVGDMFNGGLQGRVSALCQDLGRAWSASVSGAPAVFQSQTQGSGGLPLPASTWFEPDPSQAPWWPEDLGTPQALGTQNGMRYAYFGAARRLAVDSGGGQVWVYDTLDHQIGGFGQQQGSNTGIQFNSQYGLVDLSRLPVVWRQGQPVVPAPAMAPTSSSLAAAPASPPAGENVLDVLERLGGLKERGLISEAEFETKKRELLARL